MSRKHTSATPANVSRGKGPWTRRQRAEIRRNQEYVIWMNQEYQDRYGDWPDDDDVDHERNDCERCGGEGSIEYADAGPDVWGEDCPSEVNHLVECPDCGGSGRAKP